MPKVPDEVWLTERKAQARLAQRFAEAERLQAATDQPQDAARLAEDVESAGQGIQADPLERQLPRPRLLRKICCVCVRACMNGEHAESAEGPWYCGQCWLRRGDGREIADAANTILGSLGLGGLRLKSNGAAELQVPNECDAPPEKFAGGRTSTSESLARAGPESRAEAAGRRVKSSASDAPAATRGTEPSESPPLPVGPPCTQCGKSVPLLFNFKAEDGGRYCKQCFHDWDTACLQATAATEVASNPQRRSRLGRVLLSSGGASACSSCGAHLPPQWDFATEDGNKYCKSCFDKWDADCQQWIREQARPHAAAVARRIGSG